MTGRKTAAARSADTDRITGTVVGHVFSDDVKEVWVCDDPDIEFRIVDGCRPYTGPSGSIIWDVESGTLYSQPPLRSSRVRRWLRWLPLRRKERRGNVD